MSREGLMLFSWGFALLIAGYFLPSATAKPLSRLLTWLLGVLTILVSSLLTSDQTPVIRMIIIVSLLLLSMKVVVLNESYKGPTRLSFVQWSAFALGWVGMRPVLFEALPSQPLPSLKLLLKSVLAI